MCGMDGRDAFGREIGEDPLAAMGWSGGAPAGADAGAPVIAPEDRGAPAVVPAAAPASPRRPPPRRRRRRRTPVLARLLLPLMAVVVAAAAGLAQVSSSRIGSGGGAVLAPSPQTGAPAASLLGPHALRAALRKLPRGRLEYLRVSPERIDAHVLGDRFHLVSVDAAGGVTDTAVSVVVRTPRLHVNAAAPRRAAKAAHARLSDIGYLVLGRRGWDLFLAGGRHYRSDLAGRHLHRVD